MPHVLLSKLKVTLIVAARFVCPLGCKRSRHPLFAALSLLAVTMLGSSTWAQITLTRRPRAHVSFAPKFIATADSNDDGLRNGELCLDEHPCVSQNCVDGFCCEQAQCPTGQYCNNGQCAPPSGEGASCNDEVQCASQKCVDNICCLDDFCPLDESCNVPGNEGICAPRLANGDPCTDERQCWSGFCADGVCCEMPQCQSGFSCAVVNREGRCVPKPTWTPTRTFTRTPTRTPTPAPNGRPCQTPSHCLSDACTDGICCETLLCPPGQGCGVSGHEGVCTTLGLQDGPCSKDADCLDGNCLSSNPRVCGPRKTPTQTPTRTPKPPGQACAAASECLAGYFCEQRERVCCDQLRCPDESTCRLPGHEGACTVLPTRRPTPRLSCSDATQCADGLFCTNAVCCSDAICPAGQRCDIKGFAGSCSPPNGIDGPCDRHLDCAAGLRCEVTFGGIRACLPATLTPTPPPPTPTTTPRMGTVCSFDCDASGTIDIRDVASVIAIALDSRSGSCPAVGVEQPRATIEDAVLAASRISMRCTD